jgi:hypothetical protein
MLQSAAAEQKKPKSATLTLTLTHTSPPTCDAVERDALVQRHGAVEPHHRLVAGLPEARIDGLNQLHYVVVQLVHVAAGGPGKGAQVRGDKS